MRILPLIGSLRGAAKAASGMKVAQGPRAVGFSTSASRLAAEAKTPKTTSDAKVAFALFLSVYTLYYVGTNFRELFRDYYPYPWIMEEHYAYEQRLKREAEEKC